MNIKHRQLCLVAILPAMMAGSGCYTALKGPMSASTFYSEPQYAYADSDELLAPTVGRFDDPYDDRYRGYSGVAPYGGAYGGYGAPISAYDSRSGLFGSYGYGGYYPGAGPVGYGYDPYYSGAYGTYVPPGYELVTRDELDHLRANARLNTPATHYVPPPDPVLQQEREQVEQEVWQQRQESRQRTAPAVTRRPSSTVQRSTPAPTATRRPTSTTAEKSSSSDDSSKEKKKSVTPKKQRR